MLSVVSNHHSGKRRLKPNWESDFWLRHSRYQSSRNWFHYNASGGCSSACILPLKNVSVSVSKIKIFIHEIHSQNSFDQKYLSLYFIFGGLCAPLIIVFHRQRQGNSNCLLCFHFSFSPKIHPFFTLNRIRSSTQLTTLWTGIRCVWVLNLLKEQHLSTKNGINYWRAVVGGWRAQGITMGISSLSFFSSRKLIVFYCFIFLFCLKCFCQDKKQRIYIARAQKYTFQRINNNNCQKKKWKIKWERKTLNISKKEKQGKYLNTRMNNKWMLQQ